MIDDILKKEIDKSNNSIYASEGLLENINQDVSYRLGCRLSGKNITLDVPVLSYSKSRNKINIKLLVESKSLTDIILVNFNKIEIVSGLNKLEEKSFKEFSGKKVYITGADGFIGSHLTELLVRSGYDVNICPLQFFQLLEIFG